MCALSLLNNTTHTVDSWHWKKILQEIWYEPFSKDENMLLKGRIITHPLIRVYVLFWDKYQCTLLLVRFSRWWETKGNPGSSHSIQQKSLSHECSCCHLRSPISVAQGAAGCAEAHRCQASTEMAAQGDSWCRGRLAVNKPNFPMEVCFPLLSGAKTKYFAIWPESSLHPGPLWRKVQWYYFKSGRLSGVQGSAVWRVVPPKSRAGAEPSPELVQCGKEQGHGDVKEIFFQTIFFWIVVLLGQWAHGLSITGSVLSEAFLLS